jgi:GntR family transcriptional regulator
VLRFRRCLLQTFAQYKWVFHHAQRLAEVRERGRGPAAYRRFKAELRSAIEEGRFAKDDPLPTEAELSKEHGLSRHTVRQAFQDLVADGLVYRVPGLGTFVTGLSTRGRYLRCMGSLEEIMSWTGTEMEVLDPVELREEPDAATRLELPSDEVAALVVRRLYEELPFVVTHIYLPPELGKRMRDEDALANGPGTIVGTIEEFISFPVVRVSQEITPVPMPPSDSKLIDCQPNEPVLRAIRLYHDASGALVEWAVSHYNPRRYSHRLELGRSTPP